MRGGGPSSPDAGVCVFSTILAGVGIFVFGFLFATFLCCGLVVGGGGGGRVFFQSGVGESRF